VAYLIAEVIFEQFLICIACVNIANKEVQWILSHYRLAATYRDVFHAATGNALAPCNVTGHFKHQASLEQPRDFVRTFL